MTFPTCYAVTSSVARWCRAAELEPGRWQVQRQRPASLFRCRLRCTDAETGAQAERNEASLVAKAANWPEKTIICYIKSKCNGSVLINLCFATASYYAKYHYRLAFIVQLSIVTIILAVMGKS